MNYLVGYDAWTMDELKGYGSAKLNRSSTLCHAHPEIECPAVEVTTGPLGQGIANAVGLAIASKNMASNFNKADMEIIQSRIYCMTGDVSWKELPLKVCSCTLLYASLDCID